MVIKKKSEGEKLTVSLEGRLDTITSQQLEKELRLCIEGVTELIFDLEKLTYITSAGLRVISSAMKVMKQQKGRMVLRNTQPDVQEVFNLDDAFHNRVMALSHNRIVEKIADTVRTMTYDMRRESVQLMLESGRAWELYEAHEKLFRILQTRDVDGLYREIRSTYFLPDEKKGVVSLADHHREA